MLLVRWVLCALLVVSATVALGATAAGATDGAGPGLTTTTTFDGDSRYNVDPPNEQIAVGPSDVVELTNQQINVWSRTTAKPQLEYQHYVCGFFVAPLCGDPRVIYDPTSKRFFAAILDLDSGFVVGLSATADPSGSWYFKHVSVPGGIDNPRLAVTTDKVIIGDNGDDIWVYQKSDFLAATADAPTVRVIHLLTASDQATGALYGPVSVEMADPNQSDAWVESQGGTDTTAVRVQRIQGTPAAGDVRLTPTVVHLPYPWNDPMPAPQQGGPDRLADDFYPKEGVVAGNTLVYAQDEPCVPPGDTVARDCAYLVQVDIGGARPRLVRDQRIGVAGKYLVTPTVAVEADGRAVVAATETGPDMHPSMVGIPIRADGSVGAVTVLRAGETYIHAGEFATNEIRWGDYTGAALDPTDPDQIWIAGEFALDEKSWGTAIAAVHITDPGCPETAACAPGSYRPVPATRLLDTRTAGSGHPLNPNRTVPVPVLGHGGVPADGVAAVAVNVTATGSTRSGYLTAYAHGAAPPATSTSTLNFTAGRTVANLAIVPVGADGSIEVANRSTGTTHVLVDVLGYYLGGQPASGGSYVATGATRILDTRTGTGAAGPLAAGHTITVDVAASAGLSAGEASAAALNVTVTGSQAAGHLTVYPTGSAAPTTSDANFGRGESVADLVTARLGAGGRISIRNGSTGAVNVIADVLGHYRAGPVGGPGSYTPLTPARVLDTRTGLGAQEAAVAAHRAVTFTITGRGGVPSSGVTAVILRVTATASQHGGHLSVYPADRSPVATSTLNFAADESVGNTVIAPVDANGRITIANASAGATQVLADVAGYLN